MSLTQLSECTDTYYAAMIIYSGIVCYHLKAVFTAKAQRTQSRFPFSFSVDLPSLKLWQFSAK